MAWTERYVRSDAAGGGNGTTDTNSGANGAWTLAEAITNAAAGHRVNVRAGTYANTTTDRTFATAGTTTSPVWWRGFNSSIGDIDTDNSLTKPAITFTTGRFIVTGNFQVFSNLDISGAQTTNGQLLVGSEYSLFRRVRSVCTAASASGRAVYVTFLSTAIQSAVFEYCYFSANSAANTAGTYFTNSATYRRCVFDSGNNGLQLDNAGPVVVSKCLFKNQSGSAVNTNSGSQRIWLLDNTIYSPDDDGVEIETTLPECFVMADNVISNCSSYGITNATGTNTAKIVRLGSLFYSNTSGNENGFGDYPSLGELTDSSSPFAGAGSDNFLLVSTSAGANVDRTLENLTATAAVSDTGAAQREVTAGGIPNTTKVFANIGTY